VKVRETNLKQPMNNCSF